MAVNVVFLDGHGEHVPLAGLWQLKWTENSVPRDVVVPIP
jgi:prepilin-type processing-associated H-X9-DG protein